MKKIIMSTLVSALLINTSAFAKEDVNASITKTLSVKEVNSKAVDKAKDGAAFTQKKLVQEALDSLKFAHDAFVDINVGDNKKAKEDIEKALGKLEVILSAKNAPKLLAVKNSVVVKNFLGTSKDVEQVVKEVQDLLNDGKVQEARELLSTLQSEIDVSVVNLPLASYPDALKLTSKYLLENKPKEAKEVLSLALNSFTVVSEVIPIPLINSMDLVTLASDIAKEKKDVALKYLSSASDELDKAEKLGYISKSSTTYKELHTLLEGVKKEVEGPNKAEELFKNLTNKLKEFKEKILSSSDKEEKSK